MNVFYDPTRVRALRRRTESAIDAARRVRSADPAAIDALAALASLRRTLEDHWMPALIEIERSTALIAWTPTVGGGRIQPLAPVDRLERVVTRGRSSSLEQFLEVLARADTDIESTSPPTDTELDALAADLADRLAGDPDAVAAVVARAGELPLIGELLVRSGVDAAVLVAALSAMTDPVGLVAPAEIERHRATFELLLAELLGDPADALVALSDRDVLTAIAVWHDLDADLVESFTRTGLYDAVAADPGRLADGYGVLRELTALTNGSLDHQAIHPAMALGVATSMVGYVDTLAPALRHEGASRVLVVDHRLDDGAGLDVDLGSYDDLVDLFGALLRDPASGAALGAVLGGYATDRIDRLGAAIAQPPGLESVARFADLLSDATRTEQVELVMEAADREARRGTLAGVLGFGANVATGATGVGSVTRSLSSRAISFAAERVPTRPAPHLTDHQLATRTYDLVVLGAITAAAGDSAVQADAGLTAIPATRWREIRRHVARIETETDPVERSKGVRRLERWIAIEAPQIDRFLGEVRSAPGMDELTEARNAVAAD